jgi:DNA repair exonuclease SbcCD ATPase subunit
MEDEESNEETKVVDITLGDLVDAIKAAMGNQSAEMTDMEASEDDSISLDEILAELDEEEKMEEEKMKDADHSMEEAKKELEDAKKAIEEMRAELNEVNLLNAKLLYVNKIFKSKSLTESQKVKVLNAFDRATNVKEVKNVYATINESVTAAPKTQIKESYGFASKPTGYSQKTNTVESDPFIARMQKLAGL